MLLPSKEQAVYEHVLEVMLDNMVRVAPTAQYGGHVMTDLELGAINAFKKIFPAKSISTCYFHLSKAVYGKVTDIGLKVKYDTDADFALLVRMLAALAFVPPEEVADAFPEVALRLPEALELVEYFESTYVGRNVAGRYRPPRFPPSEWSQYGRSLLGLGENNERHGGLAPPT